jgi:hypothetical protein
MKNVIDELVDLYNTIGSAIEYTVDAQINGIEGTDYICPHVYGPLKIAIQRLNKLLEESEKNCNRFHDHFEEITDIELPFGEENTTAEDFVSSAMEEIEDATD